MANVFKPKRSSTASSVPTTTDLIDGELAVNSADQKIYLREGSNIVEIGNTSGGDAETLGGISSTSFLRSDEVSTKTSGSLKFNDTVHARFGTNGDLRIYHSGTASFIEQNGGGTGPLNIRQAIDDADVVIQSDDGSGGTAQYFRADGSSGEAVLYHYGSEKLATKSDGIDVTGHTETDTLRVSGVSTFGVVTATALKGFDYLQAPHGSTVNFSVTVASKTAAHRYNGTGSGSGYVIDGVESPFLTFTPGRTYRFTLSSGDMSSHPFRFYLEADKTTAYTTNVTSTATYTEIVVTDTTPTVLHYQCSAHGYMGNAVQVNSNKINTPYQIDGLSGANITGVVTATSFSGTATNASNVTLADESSDTICYPTFSTDPTGNQALKTDQSNLLYNASTGSLSAASFSGDGSTLNNVLSNLSEDETPQLGGGLDLNGSDITGSGHIDITGNLDVSGISSVGTAITMYGSTGIVSATQFYGDGSNLSSIVTQLTAGTGISLNQTTGNVTITATGGGGDSEPTIRTTSRFVATASQSTFTVSYNVGYVDVFLNGIKLDSTEYTATNGSSVSLTSAAAEDDIIEIVAFESVGITSITSATKGLDVTGHLETDTLNVSGIATITGGIDAIGIQSGGVNIATGPITALNFIGTGNTFSVNGTTVDISISGGSGGGGSTTRTVNRYVATADQTLFPSSGTISYTVGYVDVFINGTKLDSTEFTASNGTTVTLTTGATVDDVVELIAFDDVSISGGADSVTVVDESSDTSCFPLFVNDASGDLAVKTGSNLTFNASTGTLGATAFSGDGSNLTGLTGASAATYGGATNNVQITVDANGRITSISQVAVSAGLDPIEAILFS